MGDRVKGLPGIEEVGDSSIISAFRTVSVLVPTPMEEFGGTPESTIPSDSFYSLAKRAATRLGSKGFGVWATEVLAPLGNAGGLACIVGTEFGSLSERRTRISWQSIWICHGLPHLYQIISLRERSPAEAGVGHRLDMCPCPWHL